MLLFLGQARLSVQPTGSRTKINRMLILRGAPLAKGGQMVVSLPECRRRSLLSRINRRSPKSKPYAILRVLTLRDEQYLKKLRGLGLSPEDEWKLANLRTHIWKVSQLIARHAPSR